MCKVKAPVTLQDSSDRLGNKTRTLVRNHQGILNLFSPKKQGRTICIEDEGYYLVVVEAFCRYKRPLRYDETFLIRVFPEEITPKKVVFTYELVTKKDKELIAFGHTGHIATNSKTEVRSLPPHIIDKLKTSQS